MDEFLALCEYLRQKIVARLSPIEENILEGKVPMDKYAELCAIRRVYVSLLAELNKEVRLAERDRILFQREE